METTSLGASPLDPADVTLDRLAGDWWVHQLRRGHRYASDDVLTAWFGLEQRPRALNVLDLGSGVGSVGLMALLRLDAAARLTCVEVQSVSVALLLRTLAHNAIADRVSIVHGDLRDRGVLAAGARFDLILANPPYLPARAASRSPNAQRATARLELHGDVFDYCRTAARHLEPEGRFCFCHRAGDPRCTAAVAASGLTVTARRDVVFREGSPPALSLFACGHAGVADPDGAPLVLRDRAGQRTADYRAVRRAMWIEA